MCLFNERERENKNFEVEKHKKLPFQTERANICLCEVYDTVFNIAVMSSHLSEIYEIAKRKDHRKGTGKHRPLILYKLQTSGITYKIKTGIGQHHGCNMFFLAPSLLFSNFGCLPFVSHI